MLLRIVPFLLLATPWTYDAPAGRAGAPRLDAWTVIGPGGGGAQFAPAVSPLNPRLVLVTCDMGGGYLSIDGGSTWRMFNLRRRINEFAFDGGNEAILYARTTIGLWRSDDAGKGWKLVYPDNVGGLTHIDDEAEATFMGADGYPIRAIAADPSETGVVYAVLATPQGEMLHVSRNGGKSWKGMGGSPAGRIRRLYVDPHSPPANRDVYAVSDAGVSAWVKNSFSQRPRPVSGVNPLTDIFVGFPQDGGSPIVYALSPTKILAGKFADGLVISRDGGTTWQSATPEFFGSPGPSGEIPAFVTAGVAPGRGEIAYFSYLRAGGAFGVAKTVDGGRSWELAWKETPARPGVNIHDIWLTQRFGPDWSEAPLGLAVSPANPEICFGTDYGRTMRTIDGGKNWEGVYSQPRNGGFTTTGLDVTTSYELYFDPHDPSRVFIAYTDIGLFRSEDGGDSWISSNIGAPRTWRNTTYAVAFDPEVKGRMWAVMSQTHDLPRLKSLSPGKVAQYKGGVCVSQDGGKTWKQSATGMDETAATHILVDPRSPAAARVLYVAAMGKGVYKSSNGGRSWSLKMSGLAGNTPMAWRLAQDREGVLYLVTIRTARDSSYGNSQDGALYRSSDAGETWERMRLPEGVNGPTGIAIDPRDPGRLYVSAWGRSRPGIAAPTQSGGLWLSSDAGKSWTQALSADGHLFDVSVSPRNPDTVYTAGHEDSVWRSLDRGQNWQRVAGFNFHAGHRVTVDPRDENTIYVTTYGGSVWKGPAAGDPTAPEDILTPSVGYARPQRGASPKPKAN